MGAVDRNDQMVVYYRPELRCIRIWIPMMFHCFNLMRVNAYLIYKAKAGDRAVEHKEFLSLWIKAFNTRAAAKGQRVTRQLLAPQNVRNHTPCWMISAARFGKREAYVPSFKRFFLESFFVGLEDSK